MKWTLLAAMAAVTLSCIPVQAGITCNDRICYASVSKNYISSWHVQRIARAAHRSARRYVDNDIQRQSSRAQRHAGGLTTVCEGGHCGTVASSAAGKFQGLFRDLIAMGYNIGSPGCYSPTGHMRNSLHHWGGACDLFNQYARNRTHLVQPPAHVQIEVAARHGLTSGCAWRNPDCGHFDLSGIGHAYAMAAHHHYRVRYARR